MSFVKGFSGVIAAILATAATTATAMTPAQMPEQGAETWEQLLTIQLDSEQKCVLAGTVFVREMPGPDGVTISGRAKCYDGRQFDFSQGKPGAKFEIRACEPTAC